MLLNIGRLLLPSIAVFLSFPSVTTPALANTDDGIPSDFGSASEPIPMVVHLQQEELLAGRDPANGSEIGGGLVGVALDSIFKGGAENAISPSREIFTRGEAEDVLMAAIRESVAGITWVSMTDGPALRDNSPEAKRALLREGTASHLLGVDCSYNISMRFQAVYAACALELINEASEGDKAERADRWFRNHLAYRRLVEAEIEIANPARSVGGRREQWTNNSGALLRTGLEHALLKVGMLVGQQLRLTRDEMAAAEGNERYRFVTAYVGMAFEHRGRIIAGQKNILCRYYPNSGGLSYLYNPCADGMVIYENMGGLFYHWTMEDPTGPATKECR